MNPTAYDRLKWDYNFAGYPTLFFDGGYRVAVGQPSGVQEYRDRIEQCGQRAAHELGMIMALDWVDSGVVQVRLRIANGVPVNSPPGTPAVDSGASLGLWGASIDFQTSVTDSDNDSVYYQWDWGTGDRASEWIGPYASGDTCTVSHSWVDLGDYEVKVRAKGCWEDTTDWSDPWPVSIVCCLPPIRGNVDYDPTDVINIADLVFLVDWMFAGGPLPLCTEETDINGDGVVDIADLVHLVDYMFSGGADPASCP